MGTSLRTGLTCLAVAVVAAVVSTPARGAAPSSIYRAWVMSNKEVVVVRGLGSDHDSGSVTTTLNQVGTWSDTAGGSGFWMFRNSAQTKADATLASTAQAGLESMLESWAAQWGFTATVTLNSSRIVAQFSRNFTKLKVTGTHRFTAVVNGRSRRGTYKTIDKS